MSEKMRFCIVLFSFCTAGFMVGQTPTINAILSAGTDVVLYDKYELEVNVSATFTNPYDYEDVSLIAFVIKPDGRTDTIDGFYTSQLEINPASGLLNTKGPAIFKVRYAPYMIGMHKCQLLIRDKNGSQLAAPVTFNSVNVQQAFNKGFIKKGPTNYLEFDNRDQYIAIGENMCWQNGNAYLDYKKWLEKLVANGGNFIRLWHAHWGLGIEWTPGNSFNGLLRYNQNTSAYQDWLYDYCAAHGVYVMLALQHHGPVSTQVNPNWNESPYNVRNGGPCSNTAEFFTNELAKKITKNRYRYIIARWAYSRAIMSWELFNEVEWTDNFQANKNKVIQWHKEMATFIKSKDVYGHVVTTSFANDQDADDLWTDEGMDLTQQHFYGNTPGIHKAVTGLNKNYVQKYHKPTLMGEFGLGGNAPSSGVDNDGIHLHNTKWASLMSGSTGTAMTWWWDNYVDPRNLYYHFKALSKFAEEVPFLEKNMAVADVSTSGAPADLVLSPTVNWGVKADSLIVIQNGITTPTDPKLGIFLYGAQYNTQFRSPPTFEVSYTAPGKFQIRTSSSISTSPTKIKILLDNKVVLETSGAINSTYSIDVPAGKHRITVDNSGTDWISIAEYRFSGQGSLTEAYGLMAEDQKSGAMWVLNRDYNHTFVKNGVVPAAVKGSAVSIKNVQEGNYKINWYDPLSGELKSTTSIQSNGQLLNIPLQDFTWDLAFTFEFSDLSSINHPGQTDFTVYPNPASPGAQIQIKGLEKGKSLRYNIYNVYGQMLADEIIDSGSDLQIKLSGAWVSGLYWISLTDGYHRMGALPFIITEE